MWLIEFLIQPLFRFQWDSGNEDKNHKKHGIFKNEAEEVFYDKDLLPLGLQTHPLTNELRYGVIGKTTSEKILFISFTVRDLEIRIISVRKANKKEKEIYEEDN